jgi:hypothetical protein
MRAMINAHKIFARKRENKRHFGRPRCRWKDNIKIDLKEGVKCIHLAQKRDQWRTLVNIVTNLLVGDFLIR